MTTGVGSAPPGPPPGRVAVGTTLRSTERVAHTLPDWMGSVRFRLTALYSLFLFGLAALVIGGIYLGLAAQLGDETVSRELERVTVSSGPSGEPVFDRQPVQVNYTTFEQQVNERSLQLLRRYSFGALAVLFLASLVVGWLVAGRVLAPIDRITAVARDIQATDLSRRIALRGPPDELKSLADTFDGMLGRIDDAFENQRRFIQEASHELRNPLAVIRTNLEVALGDPDATAEDLRRSGEVVQRTTERMSHLVDDLLTYARQGSTVRELTRLDLADVVADTAAEFEAPAAARGLTLAHAAEPGLWVVGDRVALRQALANLVANAVRLAPIGTSVRTLGGRHDDWVWAAVDDDGPGVPEDQRDLVFQRFFRGDGRRAREEGRSGLGLTIVRQIAESHRGEVRLQPNGAGGSTFAVWLPAAPDTPPADWHA
jgi:signal transduction histidine kinase